MQKDWKEARERHITKVKELEKLMKYDYSDKNTAFITDHKICSLMLSKIGMAKSAVCDIITFVQGIDETLEKRFRKLGDELEIFSDEISARYFYWENPPAKTLELVIERDFDIAKNLLDALNKLLEEIYGAVLKIKPISKKTKVFDLKSVERNYNRAVLVAREILIRYKEREALFRLKEIASEKAFDSIRKEIEGGVWDSL